MLKASPQRPQSSLLSERCGAHARQGDHLMTENLPSFTTVNEMPTCLNRPGVAPHDSTEGRAGTESILEPAVAEAPVLITEHEVLLSTAAAVTVPRKRIATKHKHYPHHYVFLEQALMAREMERC
jgi:hypothetical protein